LVEMGGNGRRVELPNAGTAWITHPHSRYLSENLHIGQVFSFIVPLVPFSSSSHCLMHLLPKICPQAVMTGVSVLPSTFAEW
jgi:hypothetical protein